MKCEKTKQTTFTVFETKMPTPDIVFSETAMKWIDALIEMHPLEVGFYAIVDERENGSYFIRDVFYPKHSEMNGATCEISPEGETDIAKWLLDHNRDDDIEKIRFWGHSHHNMGVNPSSQDESQSFDRVKNTQAYLIRAICNKRGEMSVSFFDWKNKIRFDNIVWRVEGGSAESVCDSKVNDIIEILGDDQKKSSTKLKEILTVISIDREDSEIRDKIKVLMVENAPPERVVTHIKGQYDPLTVRSFPGVGRTKKKEMPPHLSYEETSETSRSGFQEIEEDEEENGYLSDIQYNRIKRQTYQFPTDDYDEDVDEFNNSLPFSDMRKEWGL